MFCQRWPNFTSKQLRPKVPVCPCNVINYNTVSDWPCNVINYNTVPDWPCNVINYNTVSDWPCNVMDYDKVYDWPCNVINYNTVSERDYIVNPGDRYGWLLVQTDFKHG